MKFGFFFLIFGVLSCTVHCWATAVCRGSSPEGGHDILTCTWGCWFCLLVWQPQPRGLVRSNLICHGTSAAVGDTFLTVVGPAQRVGTTYSPALGAFWFCLLVWQPQPRGLVISIGQSWPFNLLCGCVILWLWYLAARSMFPCLTPFLSPASCSAS